MVWLAPISLLVAGLASSLPRALTLYSAANGAWTMVQTQLMTARLERGGQPKLSRQ